MRLALVLLLTTLTAQSKAQWDIEDSHTTASLRGIHNVGGGVAWASGTNGTVLRTEDGGYRWQTCATPPGAEKLDFRGIQAFDENTAIVMSSGKGDLSRLYKTTDGCHTWKLLFTNPDKDGFWDAIKFPEREDYRTFGKCFGIVAGDPVNGHFQLFVTLDCGEKWERQKSLPAAVPGEGLFAASNSALSLGGTANRSMVTGGPSGPRFLGFMTTVDFDAPEGQHPTNPPPYQINDWFTWNIPQSRRSVSSGAFSVAFAEHHGTVIVGGDYQAPEQRSDNSWYSGLDRDFKAKFLPAQTPPHGYRSAVAYDPTTKTWITVGPNGTDISTDDGKNWHPLKPAPTEPQDADKNWNALSLPFVVGPNGRIGKLRPTALKP